MGPTGTINGVLDRRPICLAREERLPRVLSHPHSMIPPCASHCLGPLRMRTQYFQRGSLAMASHYTYQVQLPL